MNVNEGREKSCGGRRRKRVTWLSICRIEWIFQSKKGRRSSKYVRPHSVPTLVLTHKIYQTLLREKEINPLLPWDTALPQFINDPRYVLLPSVSARREAFDEYCRDRARELREEKIAKGLVSSAPADPKSDFEKLLREEVTSTRTSWTEWRRAWKKDRRFYGWGRDDREREKRFREWLKELGERG